MLHFIWVGVGRQSDGRGGATARKAVESGMSICLSPGVLGGAGRIANPDFHSSLRATCASGSRAPWVYEADQPASDLSISSSESLEPMRLESGGLTVLRPDGGGSGWKLDSVVPYLPWFWLCGSLSTLLVLATGLIGVEQLARGRAVYSRAVRSRVVFARWQIRWGLRGG